MHERDRRPVQRDDFGPGRAGEIAYLTIVQGIPCESRGIHQEEQPKPLANKTIGFDISANYEFVPVCSDDCEEETRRAVEKDLILAGQIPSFDRNGFGRA